MFWRRRRLGAELLVGASPVAMAQKALSELVCVGEDQIRRLCAPRRFGRDVEVLAPLALAGGPRATLE
jgi:hypothetical protein